MLNIDKYRYKIGQEYIKNTYEFDENYALGYTLMKIAKEKTNNKYMRHEDVIEWLCKESMEPYRITKFEYQTLLEAKERGYEYIGRDDDNSIWLYIDKPKKGVVKWVCMYDCHKMFTDLFQFILWEDIEPTKIDDILNNYEIIDDNSNYERR